MQRTRASVAMMAGAVLLSAGFARGQHHPHHRDAGAGEDAGPGPVVMVDTLRGTVPVVASLTRRSREGETRELRAGVVRGRCYRLLGAAVGSAQVRAQVWVRDAAVGEPVALANSEGRVERSSFCVDEAPELYRVVVRSEGESWWHLAVVEAPDIVHASAPPPSARGVRGGQSEESSRRLGAESPPTPSESYPIGGPEDDYLASQIRAYAALRPGRTGVSAVSRVGLATNQLWERPLDLEGGRCVEVVAAGVPSVGDLEITLDDPNGNRVAQDGTRRSTEALRFCAPFRGRYQLRVRMRAGHGQVAVQALSEQ